MKGWERSWKFGRVVKVEGMNRKLMSRFCCEMRDIDMDRKGPRDVIIMDKYLLIDYTIAPPPQQSP